MVASTSRETNGRVDGSRCIMDPVTQSYEENLGVSQNLTGPITTAAATAAVATPSILLQIINQLMCNLWPYSRGSFPDASSDCHSTHRHICCSSWSCILDVVPDQNSTCPDHRYHHQHYHQHPGCCYGPVPTSIPASVATGSMPTVFTQSIDRALTDFRQLCPITLTMSMK